MIRIRTIHFVVAALSASLLGTASMAQPPHAKNKIEHQGKAPAHADRGHESEFDVDIRVGGVFDDVIRDRVYGYHRQHGCPPGLAKKRNGCMPPGLAKKRYEVGHALASGIDVRRVPRDLRDILGAPPSGYYYGYVDGDLLLLRRSTNLVIDAIALSRALSN